MGKQFALGIAVGAALLGVVLSVRACIHEGPQPSSASLPLEPARRRPTASGNGLEPIASSVTDLQSRSGFTSEPEASTTSSSSRESAEQVRQRFRGLLRERLGGKSARDLDEQERWFERYCLLRLVEADYSEAGPSVRPSEARTLLNYAIATWLDASGRWIEPEPGGHVNLMAKGDLRRMLVNARVYEFRVGEFPAYSEYERLLQSEQGEAGLALDADARAMEWSDFYQQLDAMSAEAQAFALGQFDANWLGG